MHCREPSCALSGCGPAPAKGCWSYSPRVVASGYPRRGCEQNESLDPNPCACLSQTSAAGYPGKRRISQKKVTDEQTASCGVVLVRGTVSVPCHQTPRVGRSEDSCRKSLTGPCFTNTDRKIGFLTPCTVTEKHPDYVFLVSMARSSR